MKLLKKNKLEETWTDLIYLPKQIENEEILDLTVKEIYELETKGALDFGGSEYNETQEKIIVPVKGEDEKYGWWDLEEGTYKVVFNEKLKDKKDKLVVIFPHKRILETGCIIPSKIIDKKEEQITNILTVSKLGIKIKENARVAQALTLRTTILEKLHEKIFSIF